jgi:hypothetical protein
LDFESLQADPQLETKSHMQHEEASMEMFKSTTKAAEKIRNPHEVGSDHHPAQSSEELLRPICTAERHILGAPSATAVADASPRLVPELEPARSVIESEQASVSDDITEHLKNLLDIDRDPLVDPGTGPS